MASWRLLVARDDLARTALHEVEAPEPADGQAVLRADRVGMTSNNVTYAVLGDPPFRYWDFFPAEPGWGHVPLWGFADVVASRAPGVTEGLRLYGYLPTAGHLTVTPDRAGERGFRDASPHRAPLPAPYNAYALTTGDAVYEAEREDLQVLYRPLFFTSFVLADWLAGNDCFGAGTVVLSSASSKTAYGTALLLRDSGRRLVGLTSPRNVEFTNSLGVYDAVLPYDAVPGLPREPTAYLDVAGAAELRTALHEHLGDALVSDTPVGITHQETFASKATPVFFAPDQMRKRSAEWGPGGLAERFAAAWRACVPAIESWVDVREHSGPEALRAVWLDVLEGRTKPRDGHVVTFDREG